MFPWFLSDFVGNPHLDLHVSMFSAAHTFRICWIFVHTRTAWLPTHWIGCWFSVVPGPRNLGSSLGDGNSKNYTCWAFGGFGQVEGVWPIPKSVGILLLSFWLCWNFKMTSQIQQKSSKGFMKQGRDVHLRQQMYLHYCSVCKEHSGIPNNKE